MKQSDIISIIGVAIFGFIASYFIVNMLMDPDSEVVTYKTVSPITNEVNLPSKDMFNVNAINPTVEVYIGSCEDINQDGVLSDEEKVMCNAIDSEK